jgi:inositol transport system substrate-binding protein
MSFKKFLYTVLALALVVSVIAGCAPAAAPAAAPAEEAAATEAAPAEAAAPAEGGDTIKIGVSMLFDDRWLTSMREAMEAYGAAQDGVEVTFVDSKEDVAVQLGQVENFITQGMDAIVLIPANTDATDPMTQAAVDAGIPLVYVNRKPANLPEGVAFVGSDSIDAGIFQMEWIAEALGGEGNVVILNGNLSQEAAQMRTEGVKQVAANFPGIAITKEQSGNWSREEGLAIMENWLSTGDQIDAVAANNDEMAIGALAAIEAAGKLGEIIVGGVDASADALAEMDAGRLNVTVFQDAVGQGEGGIAAAIALARGEEIEPITWIPYVLVTPENYKDFMQ